eukprot:6788246-Lingulodinium_polyedra.AAC.1
MRAREAAKSASPSVALMTPAQTGTSICGGMKFVQRGLPWAECKEYGMGVGSAYLDRIRANGSEQTVPA